jgi:hypothetical protein
MSFRVPALGGMFLAATAQSLTDFGFALVLVPVFSTIWEVKSAFPGVES